MPIEVYPPEEKDAWLARRLDDVTSTEVAALFGASPYMTLFELWGRKKNRTVVEIEENERLECGRHFEASIATLAAKRKGWDIRPMKEYVRDSEARMGASFDYRILTDPCMTKDSDDDAILEAKNVDAIQFKGGWIIDGDEVEAPPHIELQVQHQLAVTGLPRAFICALIGGNRLVIIERVRSEKIIQAIRDQVKGFWMSIDAGVMPQPDFARDSEYIATLYGYAEPGKVLSAKGDQEIRELALEHQRLGAVVKEAEAKRDEMKARLLMKIGAAEKVVGDGFSISAGLIGPKHIEYDREGYRNFRINWPKQKEA